MIITAFSQLLGTFIHGCVEGPRSGSELYSSYHYIYYPVFNYNVMPCPMKLMKSSITVIFPFLLYYKYNLLQFSNLVGCLTVAG